MDYWTSAISFQRLRAKYIDCTNCRLCSELREADGHGDFLFDRHFFRLLTDRVSILRHRGRDTPVTAVYVLLLCAGTGMIFHQNLYTKCMRFAFCRIMAGVDIQSSSSNMQSRQQEAEAGKQYG